MSQDYAKKRVAPLAGRRPARAATRVGEDGSGAHWNWFFSGLFCGFLVIGIGYLGMIKLDSGASVRTVEAGTGNDSATRNSPVFDFGFYGELENAEISVSTPPADDAAPVSAGTVGGREEANTTAAPAVLTRYLLQARSFQDRQDAENRRAKIILLNLRASIEPAVVSRRAWHRVQVG